MLKFYLPNLQYFQHVNATAHCYLRLHLDVYGYQQSLLGYYQKQVVEGNQAF